MDISMALVDWPFYLATTNNMKDLPTIWLHLPCLQQIHLWNSKFDLWKCQKELT